MWYYTNTHLLYNVEIIILIWMNIAQKLQFVFTWFNIFNIPVYYDSSIIKKLKTGKN